MGGSMKGKKMIALDLEATLADRQIGWRAARAGRKSASKRAWSLAASITDDPRRLQLSFAELYAKIQRDLAIGSLSPSEIEGWTPTLLSADVCTRSE